MGVKGPSFPLTNAINVSGRDLCDKRKRCGVGRSEGTDFHLCSALLEPRREEVSRSPGY